MSCPNRGAPGVSSKDCSACGLGMDYRQLKLILSSISWSDMEKAFDVLLQFPVSSELGESGGMADLPSAIMDT